MSRDLNLRLTLQAVNQATGPLKKVRDALGTTGAALRDTRDELRGLKDQQKKLSSFRDLSKQSYATRDALRDKREELGQLTDKLATTEGPTKRLKDQQRKARDQVEKLTGQYHRQRDRVSELARELPSGIEGTRGFKEQNAALEEQIRQTNERLHAQRDAMGRLAGADVGGKFRNMTGEVRRFGRNVMFAGTAAGGSIFALANSTASLGDDVAKTADKMGISIGTLQELRYAGERAGVGTEGLDDSMQRMVRRIGRAAQGTGAAVKPMEQLGLSAQELNRMAPEKALGAISDALLKVEDHGARIAILSGIFGNSGEAMVNMLRNGSDELYSLMRAGRDTGYVLSDNAARGAEDFKDALLDAQLSLKGMKNTIGAELMPAVTELMREFTGWMRSNRDEVAAFAREFGQRLRGAVPVIMELASGAASFARTLADITTRVAAAVGGFDNLAMVMGTLFAGKAIISVISFASAVGTATGAVYDLAMLNPKLAGAMTKVGTAMAALPIGWIIAGIAAVAAGAYFVWKNWDWIGPKFAALWDGIKALPGRAMQEIRAAVDDGLAGVGRLLINWSPAGLLHRGLVKGLEALGIEVPEQFQTLGGWIIDGLIGGVRNGFADVRAAIRELATGIADWFKGVLGINSPSRVFEGFGGNIVQGIINGISGMAGALRDQVKGLAGDIAGWMKDAIGSAWASGKEIAAGIGEGVREGAKSAGRAVREGAGAAVEAGKSAATGVASGVRNNASAAADRASDMARNTIGAVKGLFQTNSPSRVFRDIGRDVTAGLAQGIQRHADEPARQAAAMAGRQADGLRAFMRMGKG